MEILWSFIDVLAVLVPVLLVVAFVTLFERKILGSMQRRVGPDTVGFYGTLQPFADAAKLLVKELVMPQQAQRVLFVLAPAVTLVCALLGWAVIPFGWGLTIADLELGWLFALAVSSVAVYGILFAGWSGNSTYALAGALRSTAQLVSYELVLSGAALIALILVGSFSLSSIIEVQQSIWLAIPLLPIMLIFLISALAELNRTPFDLPEAESELVAGYMTEHSAFVFVAFFLAEYNSIILLSALTAILWLGGGDFTMPTFPFIEYLFSGGTDNGGFTETINNISLLPLYTGFFLSISSIVLAFKTMLFAFAIVWVRGTLPRLRYDQLMTMCWTTLLPLVFGLFVLIISILLAFDVETLLA